MAKLRHIAMQVPNLEETAYYEQLFELDRVCDVESEFGNAVMLSDGTMNLTLLHFPRRVQRAARMDQIGPACTTSASSSRTRWQRAKRRSNWAVNFLWNCQTTFLASMRRQSIKIPMDSYLTLQITIGLKATANSKYSLALSPTNFPQKITP